MGVRLFRGGSLRGLKRRHSPARARGRSKNRAVFRRWTLHGNFASALWRCLWGFIRSKPPDKIAFLKAMKPHRQATEDWRK